MSGAKGGRWLSWITGAALVAAVCYVALHWSDAEESARIAERAQPTWLAAAVTLQLLTYLSQGRIWRAIGAAAGFPLGNLQAFRLSVAKLSVDQSLPAGGLTGTAAVAKYFEERGMPPAAVFAGVAVNTATYFGVYVLLLVLALLLLPLEGAARAAALSTTVVFVAGSLALVVIVLALPGRAAALDRWFERSGPLRSIRAAVASADPQLVRRPRLLLQAGVWQAAIVAGDAATAWIPRHQRAQWIGPLPRGGDRHRDAVRLHRPPTLPAPPADRVRSRRAPLWLSTDHLHAVHGHPGVRRAHVRGAAGHRDAAVRRRARGGAQPGAAARHSRREPGARRGDHGEARCARAASQRHREPRQHGRAVHRQDGNADRRRDPPGRRLRRHRRGVRRRAGTRRRECGSGERPRQSAR